MGIGRKMPLSPRGRFPRLSRLLSPSPLWTILGVIACQNLALKLIDLPLNRLIESRYCLEYYLQNNASLIGPNGEVPEKLCKVDQVQKSLAWLQGAIGTLHIACDIIMTVPLSAMSDGGYRISVLNLNMMGLTMMVIAIMIIGSVTTVFPPRALILAPIFTIIGGADCVFTSTIVALITEMTPNAAKRAAWFAYIGSVSYVVSLLSPMIAAVMLTRSIWLPFWMAIILLAICILLVNFQLFHPNQDARLDDEPETDALLDHDHPSLKSRHGLMHRSLWTNMSSSFEYIRISFSRHNFRLLVGICFFASLASSNTTLLPQYISKRYDWTFSDAGYLLSVKAAVNVLLLAFVVPQVVNHLLKEEDANVELFHTSAAFVVLMVSILGAIMIALSTKIWQLTTGFIVYAVGSPLGVFTMSLVKSRLIIGQEDINIAQDYSIIMLAKTAGGFVGLPIMTGAWAFGIGTGGVMLGAPYFLSAVFYSPACLLLYLLRSSFSTEPA